MRRLSLVALLLTAGCDAGSDTPKLGPADFRVVKVSGDAQTDTVRSAQATASMPPNVLPTPLVVKVVPKAPTKSRGALPTGPSFSTAGTAPTLPTVTFRVKDEGPCGRSFVAAVQPAADSTATTFWERGTRAGVACTMYVHTVVPDANGNPTPVVQDSFTATFIPGSAARIYLPSVVENVNNGEAYWFSIGMFQDDHGNTIKFTITVDGAFTSASHPGLPGRSGIAVAAGAKPGDTGTVRFYRDGVEILRATAKLTPGQTPVTWGVEFTRH